ncbi:MAG: hypothetical protein J7605_17135 [Variovorax sp.]|nr:hypothetical protein [Variovorax sp.]
MTAREPLGAPPLRVERLSLSDSLALATGGSSPFGALGYGTPHDLAWMPTVNARVLSTRGAMADVWHASEHIESGTTGVVRWRCDGHWMLGAIDLDEAIEKEGLAALSQRAYQDLFKSLEQTGCTHLLRIWNYLPQINGDGGGMERYRQFNSGRQQAFVEANQAAFEGAPAACALGIHQGALCIRFLAGRSAPVPVENPRQVSAYHYPKTYGPRAPTFSRAALAEIGGGDVALFISGTASIVGHETIHIGEVLAQTHETLRNLRAVIAAANERTTALFDLAEIDCVVYVRHVADAPLVRQVMEEVLGADAHTLSHAVFLEADICRQDLLVEIEAHAVARGALRA